MLKLETVDTTRHRMLLQVVIHLWIVSYDTFKSTWISRVIFVRVDYALSIFAYLIDKSKWVELLRRASSSRTCEGIGHLNLLSQSNHTTTIRVFSISRVRSTVVVALTRTAIILIPFGSLDERDLHTCHSIERISAKGKEIGMITWA